MLLFFFEVCLSVLRFEKQLSFASNLLVLVPGLLLHRKPALFEVFHVQLALLQRLFKLPIVSGKLVGLILQTLPLCLPLLDQIIKRVSFLFSLCDLLLHFVNFFFKVFDRALLHLNLPTLLCDTVLKTLSY